MPYGKTPMKKKGSMMHMGHDSAMKMGHEGSAMKNLNKGYGQQVKSPMKMQGSWMSKHSSSALHMGHSPMKMESAKQENKNLLQDTPIDDKASALEMVSPLEFHKGVPHPPKRGMLAEAKKLPKSKAKDAPKTQLNEMLPTRNNMSKAR